MKILIVKTSSLGDIIQAFPVIEFLKEKFPHCTIDWVVEKSLISVITSHPKIENGISIDLKGVKSGWKKRPFWKGFFLSVKQLRRKRYDLIFDLQGNCKSGLITFLAKGGVKVGFSLSSVREKPNILATHRRFKVPLTDNIRLQNLKLIQSYFEDHATPLNSNTILKVDEEERGRIERILSLIDPPQFRVMVCLGSKWSNKQLPKKTLTLFLDKLGSYLESSFYFVWGTESEWSECEEIRKALFHPSVVVEKLPLPSWQNLMARVDLVIAVDSSALHLCGTTSTPSFSLFGPTNYSVFKPLGNRHFAIQGRCPYGQKFDKTCPALRSCPTGSCIKDLDAEELFLQFKNWWDLLQVDDKSPSSLKQPDPMG